MVSLANIIEITKVIYIITSLGRNDKLRFFILSSLVIINTKNMLSKMQKIWLWIFGAMFIIPEILFSIIPSSIINYFGKDFLTLSSLFVNSRFFINNSYYFFITLAIEFIGVIGLFIFSIKLNKKIFIILFSIIILWLLFIFFIGYLSSNINLVI